MIIISIIIINYHVTKGKYIKYQSIVYYYKSFTHKKLTFFNCKFLNVLSLFYPNTIIIIIPYKTFFVHKNIF